MIMGRDLLLEIGIIIDFQNRKISWEGTDVSMTQDEEINYTITCKEHIEPQRVQSLTHRTNRILKAKYEATDAERIVEKCSHLNCVEKQQLKNY